MLSMLANNAFPNDIFYKTILETIKIAHTTNIQVELCVYFSTGKREVSSEYTEEH